MTDALLQVRDLRIEFETNRGTAHAVNGVNFHVKKKVPDTF
jgi:ABC-type dipeptide/oligopeptide/nickel transport system ATPase component